MLLNALSSAVDRLLAFDSKTTKRPSSEMSAALESPFAPAPPGPDARLTSVVVSATRSRTNTFVTPLLSAVERLLASDRKTTWRPSPEIARAYESSFPPRPRRPSRG